MVWMYTDKQLNISNSSDQPLFALAKLIQWKWPEVYGESMHVVMMGGLHIEMAL